MNGNCFEGPINRISKFSYSEIIAYIPILRANPQNENRFNFDTGGLEIGRVASDFWLF